MRQDQMTPPKEICEVLPEGSLRALAPVLNLLPNATLLCDAAWRIQFANDAAHALFGYPLPTLLGHSFHILLAYSDGLEPLSEPTSLTAQARGQCLRLLHRNGQTFDADVTERCIEGPHGMGTLTLYSVQDISSELSAQALQRALYRISADRALHVNARLNALMAMATKHFGLATGIIYRVEESRCRIHQRCGAADNMQPGQDFELSETLCELPLGAEDVVGLHNIANSPARNHPAALHLGLQAYLGAPVHVDGQLFGVLCFHSRKPARRFSRQDRELMYLLAIWVGQEFARKRDQDELKRLATTDPLTGAANRRALEQFLKTEQTRCQRYDRSTVALMVDLDHFKRVNDVYGHDAGDEALCTFIRIAQKACREVDMVGRWGGEEFLIVLPETTEQGAELLAQRLLDELRTAPIHWGSHHFHITASIGIATLDRREDVHTWISRADAALYDAKAKGRDQTALAASPNRA